MLVIGRVVDAGGEQGHRRLARGALRRNRAQGGEQFVRIAFDRRHPVAGEQVRKQPHHDLAVFQHVGHARRRARIVLQHDEVVGIDPDDIDAGDVHVDVVRHLLAVHLGTEDRVLKDELVGHDLGTEDIAAVIDVAQEHVERAHALLQAPLQQRPFLAGHDPRDHVEGDQALRGL